MTEGRLPAWLRVTLVLSALLNFAGAIAFLPASGRMRVLGGLPVESHALYLSTLALFTGMFGCGYLWAGLAGRVDRLFLAVGTAGKIGFFGLIAAFWLRGALPGRAVLSGAGDLLLGILFLAWLLNRDQARLG